MKKIKSILLILIAIVILLADNVFASLKVLTMEELRDYFVNNKEENEIETVEVQDNKIKLMSKDNQTLEFYYNSEKNEFYIEEQFDNTMSYDNICNKVETISTMPFFGFFAFAEKNEIYEDVYMQYAVENGFLTAAFLVYGIEENMGDNKVEYIDEFFDNELIGEMNKKYELYSIEYTKEKTQDKIIIKNSLKINNKADFSRISEYLKDKTVLITKENADYAIELKVGETYKIQTDKKLSGYSLKGNIAGLGKSVIEISEDYTEIHALNPGTVKGFIGHEEDKISIYVVVTGDAIDDKAEGKEEDKVDNKTEDKEEDKVNNKTEDKEEDKVDNKTEDKEEDKIDNKTEDKTIIKEDKLPNTGKNEILCLTIMIFISIAFILYTKINKYKFI